MIGFIIVFILGYSFYDFTMRVDLSVHESAEQTLMDTGKQSAQLLIAQINRDFKFLHTIADGMVNNKELNSISELEKDMQNAVTNYSFDRMAVVLPDGQAFAQDGQQANLGHRDYFKQAMSGKDVVSNVVTSTFTGEDAIVLAVPIFKDGQVVAVLQGSYITNFFNNVVDFESYEGQSSTYVVQADGPVVLKPENENKLIDQEMNWNTDGAQKISEKMAKREAGFSQFKIDGKMIYYSYLPAEVNDWYVITVIPEQAIMKQADFISHMAMILSAKLILALLIVGIYVYMTQRRIYRQNSERQEAKRLDDERYRIILDNLNAMIFEWDLMDETLTYSNEWLERLGYEPTIEMLKKGEIVGEEERLSLEGFFEMIEGDVSYGEEEYRLLKMDGSVVWCRLRLGGIKDKDGKTRRIIGMLEDIDVQKKREFDLTNRSQRDSLTNLYNKKTTEEKMTYIVNNNCKNGMKHGILLLDIDDFKQINDTFGHIAGDIVLSEIAKKLEELFRGSDIIGRIGGDEFLIMMRNIQTIESLRWRAIELIKGLQGIRVGTHDIDITCSVGIVVAPEDGQNFEQLYKHADEAMYFAKKRGKNDLAFYREIRK
ncbi:MAG: diguanylate cyclase [Eubacterium sp.]